ncbi:NAD-dependent epimerase/dehydratase family protein [Teredinibacter haidensis]|mgnify:CR=1 FL=1|uniref:NAD-dependent epimerase/dehydratase family protein n=1 Tax=Teredinibacter haidensis TaxID=2731755 RepID=UPI0009491963|nr:NAD-dependent epimerase/dehydratase family protein [Teredinibacter haidensis]
MKVLFIGGTGNISTASSCLAVEKGIELWHINRGNSGNPIRGVNTLQCDVNNRQQLEDVLSEHHWDCVVNWIAFSPDDIKRDIALFSGKTKQYVFISSASCYQTPPESPVINEATPLSNPMWQYSRDKIACEQLLMDAYNQNHFPATIVRPSHTYSKVIPIAIGGWTEYTAIDRIKKGKPVVVHGDGTSLWVLTHADDFAIGFVGLLGKVESLGEAYNITSDEVLTWNQIYQRIGLALGIEPKLVHVTSDKICRYDSEYIGSLLGDKSSSVIFDNSKIKKLVPDFLCTTLFAEGIKTTLDWFEADPAHRIIVEETNTMMDKLIAAELA